MSSPEFQAELMQVARKVRNKLHSSGARSSVEACMERNDIEADRCTKEPKIEETKRPEKRSARNEESSHDQECAIEDRIVEERRLIDRSSRSETKLNVYEERKGNARDLAKDYLEERQAEAVSGGKRRLVEKSATFEEPPMVRSKDPARKVLKERLNAAGHSPDARFLSERQRKELLEDYQQAKSVARSRKYVVATDLETPRSESPVRPCIRVTDLRGQGSGRESTPERTNEAKERGKERDSDRRWRKSETRNTDDTPDERRWPCEPVSATVEKKNAKSKEKLARKPEIKEVVREKNWHV